MRNWVALGLAPSDFWGATLREVAVVLDGASDRDRRVVRLGQGLVYSLAHLIGVAFNNPRKFPKFDRVFPSRPQRAQRPQDMLDAMRKWTSAMRATERVKK